MVSYLGGDKGWWSKPDVTRIAGFRHATPAITKGLD